jgi:hypothetical protein
VTSEERTRLFHTALRAYRRRILLQAFDGFERLVEDGSSEPRHLSYYGLLLAIVKGKVREGLELCESALEAAFYDPEMYLNLARLHIRTGWKSQAAKVLRNGLRIDPGDPGLLEEIRRVSPRAERTLPFLDRDHFVNHHLGKLRGWVRHRLERAGPLKRLRPRHNRRVYPRRFVAQR